MFLILGCSTEMTEKVRYFEKGLISKIITLGFYNVK